MIFLGVLPVSSSLCVRKMSRWLRTPSLETRRNHFSMASVRRFGQPTGDRILQPSKTVRRSTRAPSTRFGIGQRAIWSDHMLDQFLNR